MLRLATALGLLVPVLALGAVDQQWAVHAGGVQGLRILGSEDHRYGGLIGVQNSRPEKRFRFSNTPGRLVREVYILNSHGGAYEWASDSTSAVGILGMARWEGRPMKSLSTFFDFGIGLQLSTRITNDLSLPVNFSPTAGVGFAVPYEHGALQVTARLMHVSNAGLHQPNKGQNLFQVLVGFRF